MPNILLLVVILINIYFMAMYIKDNDLGKFLTTTGTILLVLGILIFIFFLSIDPGYGWIKPIDLTKNYIMIFAAMAVGIMGVVLITVGQQLHAMRIESFYKQARCQDIVAGQAVQVLRDEWFHLCDKKTDTPVAGYLFQNKSNRNNYKIITTLQNHSQMQTVDKLIISSDLLPHAITVEGYQSACPGVFEQDISIDYEKHQEINENVSFGLEVLLKEKWFSEEGSPVRTKNVQLTLKNSPQEDAPEPELSFWSVDQGYRNGLMPVQVN